MDISIVLINNTKFLTKDFIEREHNILNKTGRQISREFNINPNLVWKSIKLYGYTKSKPGKKRLDLSNKRFGSLIAIKYDISKKGDPRWLCICDCGNKCTIRSHYLINHKTKTCGCTRYLPSKNYKGIDTISHAYYNNLKRNAIKRKLAFDITIQDIYNIYIHQNRKCYLSGLSVDFERNYQYNQLASVDRKNNYLGYTVNNIAICHKDINKIRWNLTIDDFILWCARCATKKSYKYEYVLPPPSRKHRWSGYKDISGMYYSRLLYTNKHKFLSDNFPSIEFLWQIFELQNRKCAITSLPLCFSHKYTTESILQTASLDRIDSSIGYTNNNIQWVHKTVNKMKSNLDQEYFLNMCKTVYTNNKDYVLDLVQ